MEVIILTGPPGAGKDAVADMLERRGWKKYVFSEALARAFEREKGRPPKDKMELAEFAREIREREGRDVVARLLLEEVKEDRAVLVGARSPEEVDYIRRAAEAVVVLVDAPPELREERVPGALEREAKERALGLYEVMEMADAIIYNDGTLGELEEKVDYLLENLKWYKLGLRAGLEIHQQLDTGKLFCRCPSVLTDEEPVMEVERFLRPVASELGEYDPAAMAEFMKGRKYIYRVPGTVCLVELDEEPPHNPDEEALEAALMMALYTKAKIFPYVQVMRKVVIDGSNTTGFQRTMLIAVNGELRFPFGRVSVPTICLEEDAARPVERGEDFVVYNLDRLGIPLIEISTGPDMRTPSEVKVVAERIGMLLRATGRAKRGLGTIRQDINVSIRGGARIEIKGVQELDLIDRYVELEAERQRKLLELRDIVRERSTEVGKPIDVSEAFEETGARFIKKALSRGEVVLGFCVRRGRGLLGFEVNPGRRFGSEVADYVKVHAGLGGILHSDELPAYGITEEEVARVKELLGCEEEDAFVLLVGPKEAVERGYEVAKKRIEMARKGVPPETRSPRGDGTTSYARPLPGAARMYPETDVPPLLTEAYLERARKQLPPLPEERKYMYRAMGLKDAVVEELVRSRYVFLFDKLVEAGVEPKLAASVILTKFPYWRREGIDVDTIKDEVWVELLEKYEKVFPKGALDDVVRLVAQGKSVEEAVDELGVRMLDEQATRGLVEEVVQDFVKNGRPLKEGAIIGEVIRRSGGRASGRIVAKVLKEVLARLGKQ